MTSEKLIENYSPSGDIISVMICGILMFVITKALFFSRDKKMIFIDRALQFIMFGSASNIIFWSLIANTGYSSGGLYILRDIYHICFMCCLYCIALYLKKMLGIGGKLVTFGTHLTRLMFLLCMVLDILSPFTRIGLHRVNDEWCDSIVSPYNFCYVYTQLVLLCMLLFYSKRMIRSVRICLMAAQGIIVLVMSYQFILNTNTYTSFTYLMPVLVVMILIHSKPYDDKTGSLSAGSFDSFVKQIKQKNISVDYMVLKLYVSMIDHLPDELGKALNSFWHSSYKDAMLFDLSNGMYVLAIPKEEKNGNIEEKMDILVNEEFPVYFEKFRFPYKMVQFFDVDFIDGVDDLLGIMKYLLQTMEENTKLTVDDKIKAQLQLYKTIRDHLADIDEKNDLNDPRVLTYCQPIRNMKTSKYDTAESLMRLNLPETGLVMPAMFIELAEEYNHIHTLSKIMLSKVCRQIKELEREGYSFKRISVNFAVSEIKSDGFCEEIGSSALLVDRFTGNPRHT